MLLIDTKARRIITDQELKHSLAMAHPYQEWLNKYLITLDNLPESSELPQPQPETLLQRQKSFGYTYEELRMILTPMAQDAVEPTGAMGVDSPLAVLSNEPQLLYNYFKQLFAQVTNPPIDAMREEIVTGTEIFLGGEGNLIDPQPESCQQLKLVAPILTNGQLAKLKNINSPGFKAATFPILFRSSENGLGLETAIERLCQEVCCQINNGVNIIILSDRGVNEELAAIPALLAVSALHHYLIREQVRTQVSLIVESGEPREVHHFALLIGYGASAINPYLALETIDGMVQTKLLKEELTYHKAEINYIKAAVKGIVKTLSKMGISTIQSYQGAQIFEAVGIHESIINKYFISTPSRVGGIGLEIIAQEAKMRHRCSFYK